MRTFARAAVLMSILATMPYGPASAGTREPFSPFPPGGLLIPAGALCSFELRVVPLVNREYSVTLRDGSQLITGSLIVRLTNTETHASQVFNISGPSRVTELEDGTLVQVGKGTALLPLADGLLYVVGRAVVEIAPDGTQTLVSLNGTSQDACAMLA